MTLLLQKNDDTSVYHNECNQGQPLSLHSYHLFSFILWASQRLTVNIMYYICITVVMPGSKLNCFFLQHAECLDWGMCLFFHAALFVWNCGLFNSTHRVSVRLNLMLLQPRFTGGMVCCVCPDTMLGGQCWSHLTIKRLPHGIKRDSFSEETSIIQLCHTRPALCKAYEMLSHAQKNKSQPERRPLLQFNIPIHFQS